jgi:hypothetical protein
MKKIISALLLIALFASCEEILDRQIPAHSNVDSNVILNQDGAETSLIGVYSYLASGGYQWEWHYCLNFGHLAGTTRGSGSSTGSEEAGWEGMLIFNALTYDFYAVLSSWNRAYQLVNAANWVIKLTDELDDAEFTGNRKKEIIAEARFLRFFANFYTFRLYSPFWDSSSEDGIIYRTDPSVLSNHMQPRISVSETYDRLIEDLDYCIEHGPEFSDVYHTSKVTAKAFKAKLLAMRGTPQDWVDVKTLTEEVIGSGKFAMETDHYSIFKKRNSSKEVIFSRYFSSTATGSDLGTVRSRTQNYYRSTDWVKALSPLNSQYQKAINDTITYYTASTGVTSYNYGTMGKIASYGLTDAELVANSATLYLRLAEMHVLRAEAIARTTGVASDVTDILNPLLSRAGDSPLDPADLTDEQLLLDAVYETLLKELVAESGIDFEASMRFFDAVTGQRKIFVQKERLQDINLAILPIPMEELFVNKLSHQNPGY